MATTKKSPAKEVNRDMRERNTGMSNKFELKGTAEICKELERIARLCIEDYQIKTGIPLDGYSTVLSLTSPATKREKRSVLGHFTLNKEWWEINGETYREIGINPHLLYSMSPLDIVDTIYHETIHLYCLAANVKDCASNGRHNSRFAAAANRSEVIEAYKTGDWRGYSTRLTDAGKKWALDFVRPQQHELSKIPPGFSRSDPKRVTLVCPTCGVRVMVASGQWRSGKAKLACLQRTCQKALVEKS